MKLHRYKLGYTTFKLIESMKRAREPFSLVDVENYARESKALFFKEILAFTAEDALVQLRATEGGSLGQPPYIISIVPLEDEVNF